jgi:hypothetical protein
MSGIANLAMALGDIIKPPRTATTIAQTNFGTAQRVDARQARSLTLDFMMGGSPSSVKRRAGKLRVHRQLVVGARWERR